MTVRFAEHLLSGAHSARPAPADAPEGTLYSCTDHSLVYKNSGVAWSTWATLGDLTGILPPVTQTQVNYFNSADPAVQTVTAPTGATILIVQSETRASTGATQTNVTWTERYAGNGGNGMYTTIYTGAISGAAGTSISVDFASSTKSELTFVELALPALTTVEASTGNNTGIVTASSPPVGSLCVATDGAFNANSGTYIVCSTPHRVLVDGGCIMSTIFYFYGTTRVNFIQSATRHTCLVALS